MILPEDLDRLDAADFKDASSKILSVVRKAREILKKEE